MGRVTKGQPLVEGWRTFETVDEGWRGYVMAVKRGCYRLGREIHGGAIIGRGDMPALWMRMKKWKTILVPMTMDILRAALWDVALTCRITVLDQLTDPWEGSGGRWTGGERLLRKLQAGAFWTSLG